ncbi:SDR family NAD(P)-dependent oxidoreductase [Henriciella litoralis]|uniref:SDR family NAD(P)-dependent oxidoreductase n=1 Tax=Henriciella litoralis TaxID=568102 RepID=UPI000A03DBC6|nr:SDR family NAD(P)-dependent oxidoreductase [Henriciella litoralis]
MDKRITLITGASRGIGKAAALELVRRNHHIIAIARSKLALEKVDDEIKELGGSATLIPMDLKDKTAFETVGQALATRFGRIDGLLANAGILGTLGPLQAVGPRSFEETIEVNLTANWRLIRAMAPLLQRSEAPRAVFISSGVVPRPRAFWGPYQASKAGMEHLALAWADENENMALRVNIYDPGATRTGMRAEAMPSEDPATLPTPEEVVQKLAPLLEASETRTGVRVSFKD